MRDIGTRFSLLIHCFIAISYLNIRQDVCDIAEHNFWFTRNNLELSYCHLVGADTLIINKILHVVMELPFTRLLVKVRIEALELR